MQQARRGPVCVAWGQCRCLPIDHTQCLDVQTSSSPWIFPVVRIQYQLITFNWPISTMIAPSQDQSLNLRPSHHIALLAQYDMSISSDTFNHTCLKTGEWSSELKPCRNLARIWYLHHHTKNFLKKTDEYIHT